MKKTVVIKLGRSVATTRRGKLDLFRFEHIIKEIDKLHDDGYGVVLVISASGVCGKKELDLYGRDKSLHKGLVAAVGQAHVTARLYEMFAKHNIHIAEMLLTKDDLKNVSKKQQIRDVIQLAVENEIVTIMNENDAVEFYTFKGNDYLASDIAALIGADRLLFMTDVDGVLDHRMHVIKVFLKGKKLGVVKKQSGMEGVGGIESKINAAMHASRQGTTSWIVGGKTQNILTRLLVQKEHIGTKFIGESV